MTFSGHGDFNIFKQHFLLFLIGAKVFYKLVSSSLSNSITHLVMGVTVLVTLKLLTENITRYDLFA